MRAQPVTAPKAASADYAPGVRARTLLPLMVAGCMLVLGCTDPRKEKDATDAAASSLGPLDASALATAEDMRTSAGVASAVTQDHDPRVRRRAALALSRIADPEGMEPLLSLLGDADAETAAWAAYGLGYICKGHEESFVRALSARAAPLAAAPDKGADNPIDVRRALGRAVGRCGGPLAEAVLTAWVRVKDGPMMDAAVLGLSDLASHKKDLGDAGLLALLYAATGNAGEFAPRDMAFYGLSRITIAAEWKEIALKGARTALGRPSDARLFAIKTLAHCGKEAVPDLAKVVAEKEFTVAERAEAARSLGALGDAGKGAALDLLGKLTPDKDAFAIIALGGDEFAVLSSLLSSVGVDAPKRASPVLSAVAQLRAPGEPPPMLSRRLAELRCTAALSLAHAAWDADVLAKCDDDGSYAKEHAVLSSMLESPITGAAKKEAFAKLAHSAHVRVREQAVEGLGLHAELGELGRTLVVEGLSSDKPGLVATTADLVSTHPERLLILAESEKRAALDPRAPPPSANPVQEVDAAIARALSAALAKPWKEDLVETRLSLLDAAAAVHLPAAKAAADAACQDTNVTTRGRAQKALRALGDNRTTCTAPKTLRAAAPEVLGPHASATLTLVTDAGELGLVLTPELAPVTVARITSLARSGFYKGIVVHRVVPAFVVQFGDPDGDGYGGSGTLLRCETSPVPFARLDVGMALAGRDTGSSQLFVTLARTPHLDGEYTRIGHATGDWDGVVEGDVITDVKIK